MCYGFLLSVNFLVAKPDRNCSYREAENVFAKVIGRNQHIAYEVGLKQSRCEAFNHNEVLSSKIFLVFIFRSSLPETHPEIKVQLYNVEMSFCSEIDARLSDCKIPGSIINVA